MMGGEISVGSGPTYLCYPGPPRRTIGTSPLFKSQMDTTGHAMQAFPVRLFPRGSSFPVLWPLRRALPYLDGAMHAASYEVEGILAMGRISDSTRILKYRGSRVKHDWARTGALSRYLEESVA
jgi:hypothetical protein